MMMSNEGEDEAVGAADMSANVTSNDDSAVAATKETPEHLVMFNLLSSHLKIQADVRQERDYSVWKSAQEDDYTLWVSDKETEFITWSVDGERYQSKVVLALARWKHTAVGNFIQFRQGQDLDYAVWLSLSSSTTFKPAATASVAVRKNFSAWTTRHDGEYAQFKLAQEGDYYQIKSNLERHYARMEAVGYSILIGGILVAVLVGCIGEARDRKNANARKR